MILFSRNSQLEDEPLIMQMAEVDLTGVFISCVNEYNKIIHYIVNIRLMEEILHQLIGSLSVFPIIYKDFYIPGGCSGFLNHQQ